MRYYVTVIENTTNGENRSVPFAYDSKDEAMAKYHSMASKDISAEAIIGYIALVWDNNGNILVDDKWGTMEKYVAPEVEEVAEEVTE